MAHDDEPRTPEEPEPLDEWIEQTMRERPLQPDDGRGRETPDPQLIQELQHLYQAEAQAVDRRLERVRRHLDERTTTRQSRQEPTPRALPVVPQRREHRLMPNPLSRLHPPERWSTRLGALAAAVLLVALVGGLTAGIILVHHGGTKTQSGPTPTATATPSPTPTPGLPSNLSISDLQMKDATSGWATAYQNPIVSGENTQILHTSDGGEHWKMVTPRSSALLAQSGNAALRPDGNGAGPRTEDFLTGSVAWVLQLPNHLFRTTDGGQTWQQETAPGAAVYQFTFLDALHGWVLAQVGEALATFRTTNGGVTWTQMQRGANEFPLQYPFWGMRFLDLNTGWLVFLNDPLNGVITVFKTDDSGATWHEQQLDLPAAGAAAPVSVNPPQFFNDKEGVIQVGFDGGLGGQLHGYTNARPESGGGPEGLYFTHDGGKSWAGPVLLNGLEFPDFIDTLHGWALNNNGAGLLTTSDGGLNWAVVAASSNFIDVSFTRFVSSQIGWALKESVYGDNYSLLKTTDGGQTWTEMNFNISN
ncbi:MAG TPA: hypothetical protein VKT82_09160 [Ktedonobacterales bacterium]|nr:hypothetical protein [Ktedonobacterales bacterium]